MKKIVITGANGLLGQKLINLYDADPNVVVLATGRQADKLGDGQYHYQKMDITSDEEVDAVISQNKPDVIINAAALTQVDQCETDKEKCWNLNVTGVAHLIKAAEKNDSFLVHLSTDFIFDGEAGPYKEEDEPNPISYYGESKLASEKLLEESTIKYAIVRTQLVYGIVPNLGRSNIILWVKKSLEEGKNIKVVNDQWRTPTLAEDLAKGCALIAENNTQGVFNISGEDLLTPYDMAMATCEYFQLDASLIEEVDGSIFKQAAKRPPKTGFILDKAKSVLGFEPVSFKEGIGVLKSQIES